MTIADHMVRCGEKHADMTGYINTRMDNLEENEVQRQTKHMDVSFNRKGGGHIIYKCTGRLD